MPDRLFRENFLVIVDLNNKKEEDLPYSGDSPLFHYLLLLCLSYL